MSDSPQALVTRTSGLGELESKREQRLSHDLRQSLATVMTLAALVGQDLSRVPEVLRRLDQIRGEAEWMTHMVAGDGPRASDVQVVDVGAVVERAWSAVAATTPCRMRVLRDADVCAIADPIDLTRAVRNLLDNAVRAAGPEGLVEVEVLAEADVLVVVRDSGPGFGNIPSQQGLGLVTVRRFAASCGGRLDAQNAPRGGAELRLRLPRHRARRADGELACAL